MNYGELLSFLRARFCFVANHPGDQIVGHGEPSMADAFKGSHDWRNDLLCSGTC